MYKQLAADTRFLFSATFARWLRCVVLCAGAEDEAEQPQNDFFSFSLALAYADTVMSNLPLMSRRGEEIKSWAVNDFRLQVLQHI